MSVNKRRLNTNGKVNITHTVVMGDSLSDRGTLNKRKLFGFIPLGYFAGLTRRSPQKRFTNGYVWDDYFLARNTEQFLLDESPLDSATLTEKNCDIADLVLTRSSKIKLNNDTKVDFNDRRYARTYCEGGLTAYDYSHSLTIDLPKDGARQVVSSLKKKRHILLQDDNQQGIMAHEKARTLVISLAGANDLMTVNPSPTRHEVDAAIHACINNIIQLKKHGYEHFVLFNLPDLSLTPYFAKQSIMQRYNAKRCCEYFNSELKRRIAALNDPHVALFDLDKEFKEVYCHPSRYGFDRKKLNAEFVKANTANPSSYFFWDDVHPTTAVHAHIEQRFHAFCKEKFNFTAPPARHEYVISAQEKNILDRYGLDTPKTSNPPPSQKEAIYDALNSILTYLQTIEDERDYLHEVKRAVLEELIVAILEVKDNIFKVKQELTSFKEKHSTTLSQHRWAFFDKLTGRETTRSQQAFDTLEHAIDKLLPKK